MRLVTHSLVALFFIVAAQESRAFDENGYRTGMSPLDVSRVAVHSGFTLYTDPNNSSDERFAAVPSPDGREFLQLGDRFVFCDGKLATYVRQNPDTQYVDLLELMLMRLGQPSKTDVTQTTLAGVGLLKTVRNYWYPNAKDERVLLAASFRDKRETHGGLVFTSKTRCTKEW